MEHTIDYLAKGDCDVYSSYSFVINFLKEIKIIAILIFVFICSYFCYQCQPRCSYEFWS